MKLDATQLNTELARKMLNPYYLTDKNLRVGFKTNLDSHHINHADSKLPITPNYPEFGIEVRYINKIMEELSGNYARLIIQNKFKYQTVFSARFDKQGEVNQPLNETELFINLNINHNLTETDIDNIDIKSPLKHQIQQQEMKDSGWRFDKINPTIVCFYKTGELNGSKFVESLLRSNANLNIENNDKNCFIWSILASLHPCNITIILAEFQIINNILFELYIQGFDFSYGCKCNDVHRFNGLNNISINIFELNVYRDQNKWRHKLIPIEISKNNSERVIDLAIYKNHYVLIKKSVVFSGDHNKKIICRQCFSSYTSENMLMKHKQKCAHDNITTLRTSKESDLHWKNIFIEIHYTLGFMQIAKLIMKRIILV